MRDVKPFFIPPAELVRPSTWGHLVDDTWEELGVYVENWDYRSLLKLRSSIEADVDLIRSATRLADDVLVWSFGWRAADTGLVGTPVIVEMKSGDVSVELDIPARRAGATVILTRRLLLQSDRLSPAPGEARWAGSILWSDETTVRLTGHGAAFPTEVVDFHSLGRDPGASWYLDLPVSVDVPAMGAMILLINSADKALVAAVSRSKRHTAPEQLLIETMEEGVVEEFVRWALTRWSELEDLDPDSVGSAAKTLTMRILPDPEAWSTPDIDLMALKSAIVDGARRIGFGRSIQ